MASPSDLGIDGIEDLASLDIDGSAIYRAREVRHYRQVAIKILDASLAPLLPPRRFDPRRRPLHEFAQNEGVVPVYRSGTTNRGDRYLMTPYYRAGSLADQLAFGSTPWHASTELVARIAELLAGAHEAGVVLMGITPSSILLANATSPLLSVYGMATRRVDSRRPDYRAPEVPRGSTRTAAADVYSLGLTLAALIAGRTPTGDKPAARLIGQVESVAPSRIVDVLAEATMERPQDRPHSAGELAVVLRAAIGGEQIPDAPPPPGTETTFDFDELLAPRSAPSRRNSRSRGTDPVVRKSPPPLPDSPASTIEQRPPPGRPDPSRPLSATPRNAAVGTVAATRVEPDPETTIDLTETGTETEDQDEIEAGDQVEVDIDLTDPDADPHAETTGDTSDREDDASPLARSVGAVAPPPPLATRPFLPVEGLGNDDEVPFRTFDHRAAPRASSRFAYILDSVQFAWLQIRRSLGALLAAITLLIIAALVAIVVFQQRRATQSDVGADASFSTVQEEGSASTFEPTSIAPAFIEPPATHGTSANQRGVQTRIPSSPPATLSAPAAPSSGVGATTPATRRSAAAQPSSILPSSAASSALTTARRAATIRRTTISPTTIRPATTATTSATTPTTTGSGPPLLDVSAHRLRRTSARIRVTSDACVTTTFTYEPTGGASGNTVTIDGGTRCSRSQTLNLGQVTPRLEPGTTYSVTVTATDDAGRRARSQISFTTLA